MSQSDKDPTLSLTRDRSAAKELEANRTDDEPILGYVNRVYSNMRADPEYTPILYQFNRMGIAALNGVGPISKGRSAFVMGEVLGLEALEIIGGPAVRDQLYTDINKSYGAGQVHVADRIGLENREKLVAPAKRSELIAEFFEKEIGGKSVVERTFDEERELIAKWAYEMAPDDPLIQERLIQGFLFVRHRAGGLLPNPVSDNADKEETLVDDEDSNQRFADVVLDMQEERFTEGTPVSIEPLRHELVDRFESRNETFNDLNLDDKRAVAATLEVMSDVAHETLEELEGLSFFDTVQITGQSIAGYKRHGQPMTESSFMFINSAKKLRGIVYEVSAAVIPREHAARKLIEKRAASSEGRNTDLKLKRKDQKIGAVLCITDAVFIDGDGNINVMPKDMDMMIPLEYIDLSFSRIDK